VHNSAIEVFSRWALEGRDEGMENGHAPSVEVMISKVLPRLGNQFKSIDVGCGNGWAVRRLSKLTDCASSMGVDGSTAMINKAKKIDPEGNYEVGNLPSWSPHEKVDLVFSMEFIYYLEDPSKFIKLTHDKWLLDGGTIAIGMDHYLENESSLSWPDSMNLKLATRSIQDWLFEFKNAGFTNLEHYQTGRKDNWAGTLIILGTKE
jgi:trans-aconitate methyltransferase